MIVASSIQKALAEKRGVVALESSMLSHDPEIAFKLDNAIRAEGAEAAFTGILAGEIIVGLDHDQIEHLTATKGVRHCGRKDLPAVVAKKLDAFTNISATLFIANRASIHVLSSGGIGGVHNENPIDISSDLFELTRNPVVLVCSGVKALLNMDATRERLETLSVPVVGYGTDELPAFYTRSSGLRADFRVDSPEEVAVIVKAREQLCIETAILLGVPVPEEDELDSLIANDAAEKAGMLAREFGIKGSAITPFMLARIDELTQRASRRAITSLLVNNGRVAAQIAVALEKLA